MIAIKYRYEDVDGLKVFYREAGHADASALLLLHGFPSASHMFRDLIPLLADRFHIIAPDLPGFGQSEMPARSKFSYTFDNIAGVIDRFTEVVGLRPRADQGLQPALANGERRLPDFLRQLRVRHARLPAVRRAPSGNRAASSVGQAQGEAVTRVSLRGDPRSASRHGGQ